MHIFNVVFNSAETVSQYITLEFVWNAEFKIKWSLTSETLNTFLKECLEITTLSLVRVGFTCDVTSGLAEKNLNAFLNNANRNC